MPGSLKKRRRVRDRTDFAQTRRGTQGGVDARQAQERGTAALHFLPAFPVQEPLAALAIRAVMSVLPFLLAGESLPGSSPGLAFPRKGEGEARSLLQLALQQFDLVGQRGILADQGFDLANGVQHRGVVAATEAASDFGQ
jgi:hypothetical protein